MNRRIRTTCLDAAAVKALKNADHYARKIGRPLNTLITIAPYRGRPGEPPDAANTLARARRYLAIYVRRHAALALTCAWGVHAAEDGSNPHVHILAHVPRGKLEQLAMALARVFPGEHEIDVRPCTDQGRVHLHASGYHGSALNYMLRFMTQRAYEALNRNVRREARPDETGTRRGIAAPFVGRRWGVSRDIGRNAQQTAADARRGEIIRARISEERRRLAGTAKLPSGRVAPMGAIGPGNRTRGT